MNVLITLTDVEPAVRLNALLEADGVKTTVVSPMDDLPREIRRAKPDVIVFTGALLDPQTLGLVRDQLWGGASVIGLADVGDPAVEQRLKSLGFADVLTKLVNLWPASRLDELLPLAPDAALAALADERDIPPIPRPASDAFAEKEALRREKARAPRQASDAA